MIDNNKRRNRTFNLHVVIRRGWFHQHFTQSFYTLRSQRRKKDWWLHCNICTFGICARKTAHKMLVKMTPGDWNLQYDLMQTFSLFLLPLYATEFLWWRSHVNNNSILLKWRWNRNYSVKKCKCLLFRNYYSFQHLCEKNVILFD